MCCTVSGTDAGAAILTGSGGISAEALPTLGVVLTLSSLVAAGSCGGAGAGATSCEISCCALVASPVVALWVAPLGVGSAAAGGSKVIAPDTVSELFAGQAKLSVAVSALVVFDSAAA